MAESHRMSTNTKAADEKYCSTCGEIIKKQAELCPECGVRQKEPTLQDQPEPGDEPSSEKDRVTAGILALVLGGLGAHKFYLGKYLQGILYITFVWTFIPVILALIEGIQYLRKSDEEFQRKYAT